jgi:hypothetical protein
MMTRTTKLVSACMALAIAVLVAGCAGSKRAPGPVVEKDVSRVIKLKDGTTCVEPAGLAETRNAPGAVQLKALFDSESKADEALAKVKEFKYTREDVEAVYFDACRAYSRAEITKEAFGNDIRIYLALRQELLVQGVKQWQDKKDGIADSGKLCLVSLDDSDSEHRSFTRVVPTESLADDCAQLALKSGSSEILLGCTRGHWDNTWAKRSIALGAAGTKTPHLSVKGTAYAPDPDCGWN